MEHTGHDDIRAAFYPIVNGQDIIISENVRVKISVFARLFEGRDLTYNDLVDRDGGHLGYKDFFDKCKLEGILN